MNRPSVAQRLLIGLVRGYQLLFSVWLGGQCRFEPTCSAYAVEALRRHGAGAGSLLAAGRLLRCHPWCAGGCDPVPPRPLFRRLVRDADVPAGDPCSSRETTAS